MNDNDEYITSLMRNPLGALRMEDLVVEALRDLVKDEIKRHIRRKLDEDPKLKAEIREAIGELMEAKIREAYALVKVGKCGAELGLALVPSELKKKIDKDIANLLEKEVSQVIGRME